MKSITNLPRIWSLGWITTCSLLFFRYLLFTFPCQSSGLSGKKSPKLHLKTFASRFKWLTLYFARWFGLSTLPKNPTERSSSIANWAWDSPAFNLISLTLSIINSSISVLWALVAIKAITRYEKLETPAHVCVIFYI